MNEFTALILPCIEVVEEIGSTNAELLGRGRAGASHGTALRACRQSAGRGQRAHGWTSPEGGLYFSVLVRPEVPATMLPGLPIACSLGILEALHAAGCSRAQLKWPNDVVVGGHKLAGILTELGTCGSDVFAVCGVGLNMQAPQVEKRRTAGAAALEPIGLIDALEPGFELPSLDELAQNIRTSLLGRVECWQNEIADAPVGEAPLHVLVGDYNVVLAYVGMPVNVFAIDGNLVAQGTFVGVDEQGSALVTQQNGTVVAYSAVDVSIRPCR